MSEMADGHTATATGTETGTLYVPGIGMVDRYAESEQHQQDCRLPDDECVCFPFVTIAPEPDLFALPTTEPVDTVVPVKTDPVSGIPMKRGRYALPDPFTGEERTWQRVTNFISAMDDSFALRQWRERRLAFGLGQRPGLVALASSLTLDDEDKGDMDSVIGRAMDAAGANEGADMGTALHTFTARLDRGELRQVDVPEPYLADLDAYLNVMMLRGIERPAEFIERTTCVTQYNGGVVGTFDRLVRTIGRLCQWCEPGSVLHVADLKTGQKELEYGQLKAAMQLHCYALGAETRLWDHDRRAWVATADDVCQHVGLLVCLPVGSAECTLHRVNLEAGRVGALLADQVHAFRRGAKPVTVWGAP